MQPQPLAAGVEVPVEVVPVAAAALLPVEETVPVELVPDVLPLVPAMAPVPEPVELVPDVLPVVPRRPVVAPVPARPPVVVAAPAVEVVEPPVLAAVPEVEPAAPVAAAVELAEVAALAPGDADLNAMAMPVQSEPVGTSVYSKSTVPAWLA